MVLERARHVQHRTQAARRGPGRRNPPAGEPAAEALEARLAEVEARHAEMADAYLRAKADAENTRRRSEDEIAKARKYAVEGFAEACCR